MPPFTTAGSISEKHQAPSANLALRAARRWTRRAADVIGSGRGQAFAQTVGTEAVIGIRSNRLFRDDDDFVTRIVQTIDHVARWLAGVLAATNRWLFA